MRIATTTVNGGPAARAASQEGGAPDALADQLLISALAWEARDRAETTDGIRRGLEDSDAGRVRPFAEFAAEMRQKHALPTQLSDAELHSGL